MNGLRDVVLKWWPILAVIASVLFTSGGLYAKLGSVVDAIASQASTIRGMGERLAGLEALARATDAKVAERDDRVERVESRVLELERAVPARRPGR